MNLRILMVVFAFLAGIAASSLISGAVSFETPNDGFEFSNAFSGFLTQPILEMPTDRVKESQIEVFQDKVILDIQNAEWSTFTPTKSMIPFLDSGANAIQVKPKSDCSDVQIGDIISYESEFADGIIIHRVIGLEEDSQGKFFIAKGDNNPKADPGKIRCNQIKRVLIAIIY